MTEREVSEKVEKIIRDCLGLDPSEDIRDASFDFDLGTDELDIVEIVLGIEEEFEAYNLEIDEDVVEKMNTVYDIVMYVCDRLGVDGH